MSFSMDLSNTMAQTTYIIYRGEPFDASAPLNFFPAKDSDELFDALRAKYPTLKTHSERMREAVIDFLMDEQAAESFSNTTPSLYDGSTAATSPTWQQSWPSMSSTTQSTPELLNMATPHLTQSPLFPEAPNFATMSRQASNATESTGSITPALDQMTSVFALSTSEQPRQRIRRKMTEAEKVEYRKRRIAKACEKCSKRKRKCNHNQSETEALPAAAAAGKTISRVSKSRNTVAKPAQHLLYDQQEFTSFDTTASSTACDLQFAPTQQYEDFDYFLNEPAPEVDLDEMLQHFDQPIAQQNNQHQPRDWTASDADWTLMNTPDSEHVDNMAGLLFPDSDLAFHGPLFGPQDLHGNQQDSFATGEQQPTHTAHLHGSLASSSGSQGFIGIDSVQPGALSHGRGMHLPAVPLEQAVLRINGTAKAVRAFQNANARANALANVHANATSDQLRRSLVSMDNIAILIGSAVAHAHNNSSMSGASLDKVQSLSSDSVSVNNSSAVRNVAINSALQASEVDSRQDGECLLSSESVSISAPVRAGSLHRRADAGGDPQHLSSRPLGLQPRPQGASKTRSTANAHVPELDGPSAVQPRPHGPSKVRSSPNANASSAPMACSALTSRVSIFDGETPAYNGRSGFASASASTSPSAEMYMLKRRIPKALHSIVDRDAVASSSSPLLKANVTGSQAVISRQANGGAYLRLDTDNYTRPSRTASASADPTILTEARNSMRAAPVHSRISAGTTALTHTASCPGHSLSASPSEAAKSEQHGLAVALTKSAQYPQLESGTDTNRYRDHHGRTAAPAASDRAAMQQSIGMYTRLFVGAAMLVAALLLSASISSSMLLLVLLCPQAEVSKCSPVFDQTLWSWFSYASMLPIVQCSVENSAWLAGLLASRQGLPGFEVKKDKPTSLWYARCEGWRMHQEERQDASGGAGVACCAPVEVA